MVLWHDCYSQCVCLYTWDPCIAIWTTGVSPLLFNTVIYRKPSKTGRGLLVTVPDTLILILITRHPRQHCTYHALFKINVDKNKVPGNCNPLSTLMDQNRLRCSNMRGQWSRRRKWCMRNKNKWNFPEQRASLLNADPARTAVWLYLRHRDSCSST